MIILEDKTLTVAQNFWLYFPQKTFGYILLKKKNFWLCYDGESLITCEPKYYDPKKSNSECFEKHCRFVGDQFSFLFEKSKRNKI